ncbi:3-oxoacyl-ACP synthase [Patiriisocius marinistellae]|uniref:3-oxoacyl-ACP synthase n=1 Tax=Patiriisocius marinistellae TaxID=2494560 RepID=A0A5J4FSP6_9FLAO|nr:beta-ketoacyl synthase N-terminal-like domain-containing protein [Patiriisocius marinistellae]GEQ85237.1 3-oxoacyl-ACP synthase [Patiriisocius marinistellae]
MMKKVYINSVGSISSQKTFDNDEFLNDIINYHTTNISVVNPNYKEYLDAGSARRMAKGIKMGVVASKIAMDEAGVESVDAVITGTGMGCVIDSEKFVSRLIDNNEEYLTPTSFIQSTHNTVGGQIALGIQCKGYNFTYVHSSSSFESALIDAKLQLTLDEASTILVGGIDELGPHMIQVHGLIKHIKQEKTIDNLAILNSGTEGAVFSEGANFFVLSNGKENTCYAELVDVEILNTLSKERLEQQVRSFLNQNKMTINDVDVIVLGNNGDVSFDEYYSVLTNGLFKNTQHTAYKHLSGEFKTVSSFGFWLGAKMLKTQSIPQIVKLNDNAPKAIKNVLIYNQYRGENHTFVMLRTC